MTDYTEKMKKHSRKERLRDARRKTGNNRSTKKPRRKDWGSDYSDDWDGGDYLIDERILPRGEHERRRKLEALAFDESLTQPETAPVVDADSAITGLVVEVSSGLCRVEINDETLLCSLRGNLKIQETGYSNLVAVGDHVIISRDGSESGVVESVLPRRSVLVRPHGRVLSLRQIVVANVDQILIVASWREPHIWPELLDRYLIAAQRNDLEAIICINKIDLIEDQMAFDAIVQPYSALGYRLVLASAVTGEGIDELRTILGESATVLAGLSGVGKSSLLTAIQPDLDLHTESVAERGLFQGQGRHTTTQASLWKLKNGGIVIDTPGIRSFGLAGITQSELAGWYPEMASLSGSCRYADCTHLNEPECMIKDAVKSGRVSQPRYKNYSTIRESLPVS
ncbi:MAG: ribosome small subunit-dependent GTPase A [Anaerolineales bacterium]|nr:ribosome small subunit-dependent GTPase A [Anaerolineales bacterium]